jgi:putative CocE/NonD family hydrolase
VESGFSRILHGDGGRWVAPGYTVNAPAAQAWKSALNWPPPGARPVDAFLRSVSGGQLTATRAQAAGAGTTFTVRYDVDCPTARPIAGGLLTGAPPCPIAHAGPHFTTAPLTADVEVTGDPVADLWISSSTPDANVFVYLEDVGPDGTATPVTDARLKASLRKVSKPPYENYGLPWQRSHAEDAAPLQPGTPTQMTFTFLPASHVFKAGHRIQISVAGADYRERVRTAASPVPQLTLHETADHALRVVLPIVGATTPPPFSGEPRVAVTFQSCCPSSAWVLAVLCAGLLNVMPRDASGARAP